MYRENWTVGTEGIRPAGKPDACFYCNERVGDQHAADCVIRQRTVTVRMTLTYTILVPESWTAEHIRFQRNDSRWCANNARFELAKLFEHIGKEGTPCLCSRTRYEFIGEATAEDERDCGVFVSAAKS